LKIYEKEILLVGVYMPFDNSKNKKETLSLYEISLSLIATLICKAQSNDIPIFVIGDFNADLKRKNKFDKILKNYTENYHLSALINQFPQNIHYTFTSKNKETFFNHQIDHAFFVNDLSNTITIERCNIMDNEVNTSDHNAVSFEFSFIKNLTKKITS
jgi:endonuclease/exonuclease/phosphatase family metal-dependent hydrolase